MPGRQPSPLPPSGLSPVRSPPTSPSHLSTTPPGCTTAPRRVTATQRYVDKLSLLAKGYVHDVRDAMPSLLEVALRQPHIESIFTSIRIFFARAEQVRQVAVQLNRRMQMHACMHGYANALRAEDAHAMLAMRWRAMPKTHTRAHTTKETHSTFASHGRGAAPTHIATRRLPPLSRAPCPARPCAAPRRARRRRSTTCWCCGWRSRCRPWPRALTMRTRPRTTCAAPTTSPWTSPRPTPSAPSRR